MNVQEDCAGKKKVQRVNCFAATHLEKCGERDSINRPRRPPRLIKGTIHRRLAPISKATWMQKMSMLATMRTQSVISILLARMH